MIDGCHDGWGGAAAAGGIPVCVLAGSAQQDNSCARATRDGTLIKERDYIGLGLAGQEQGFNSVNATAQLAQDKMECDNVELSLGLSLPEKAAQAAPSVEQPTSMGSQADHTDQQSKLKLASPGAKLQHFWHQTFRVNLSNDNHQHANLQAEASNGATFAKSYTSSVPAWGSVAPGRFTVPVPKIGTVPAKRPCVEAAGERRSQPTAAEAAPLGAMSVPGGLYAWNTESLPGSTSAGGGWQQVHVNFDQVHNHHHGSGASSVFGQSRQLAGPTTSSPHFKVPQAIASTSMPPINSTMATNGGPSSSQAVEVSAKPEPELDNNRSKAPVVGWPPVRSFRKNTLQAAQTNRTSSEDFQTKSIGGTSNGGAVDVPEHVNANNSKNAFFVKAKLDGVRICRKVDLKAYNSYDGLKSALQEMFQGFVSDNAKLDLLHGNNYVVTHEDKDGDCLLVGDVPWPMFVESSVKSLRIMKAMDAIGIGDKGSAKLKTQVNGLP
eukprot:c19383_g1_i1 orf=444-1922(-)